MSIELVFKEMFKDDKDVKKVCCVKCDKNLLENNIFSQQIKYNDKTIIYNWVYCRGVVIIDYCEV